MNNVEATVRCIYICQTIPAFDELINFIGSELGLGLQNVGHLRNIQALHGVLLQQSQQGGTTVLVIDEAQNLGEENLERLRLLLNLETTTDKLLQIVLVGQPALERQLEHAALYQLKQRVALQRRLARLTDREVGAYIYHRLQLAGFRQRRLFTPEAMKRIVQYADGLPRLIHILCDNALLNAYGASRKKVTAEIIDEVAADHHLVARTIASGEDQQTLHDNDKRKQEGGEAKYIAVIPQRRRLARVAVITLLAILLSGSVYSSRVRNHLSHLTLEIENVIATALKHLGSVL